MNAFHKVPVLCQASWLLGTPQAERGRGPHLRGTCVLVRMSMWVYKITPHYAACGEAQESRVEGQRGIWECVADVSGEAALRTGAGGAKRAVRGREARCPRQREQQACRLRAARAHCRPRVAATRRDGGTDRQRRAFLASLWGQGDALRKLWAGEGHLGTDPEVELYMLEIYCPVTVGRWEKQARGEADVCSLSGYVGGSCWKLWGWGGPSACSQAEAKAWTLYAGVGCCLPRAATMSVRGSSLAGDAWRGLRLWATRGHPQSIGAAAPQGHHLCGTPQGYYGSVRLLIPLTIPQLGHFCVLSETQGV